MNINRIAQFLILVVGVLLLTNVSLAQEAKATLDSFWGIKFGSSITETKKILPAKKTGTMNEKDSSDTSIVLEQQILPEKQHLQLYCNLLTINFTQQKLFLSQL